MTSTYIFLGAGFSVADASVVSPTVIRVGFNNAPKATNPAASDDGTNKANYSLSGPGPYSISSATAVIGNVLAIDLTLAAPLSGGSWTVTVSNVTTDAADPLTAPVAAVFTAASTASATSLTAGAENDTAESIIRKHLSPALKGPNWDALIAALSTGDETNFENSRLAFNQLFVSTSSGSYLERKANDLGTTKPLGVGISDELFRKLVIKGNSSKVVHESIRQILEIYYGQDSLRAYSEATLDEPYNLSGNQTLSWTLDESSSFIHTFETNEFGTPTSVSANEVAFSLTNTMRKAGSNGYAISYQSPLTGKSRVRIYSGALGLGSSVRITAGDAQNILSFPTSIDIYSGDATGYSWDYSQPTQGVTRITLTRATAGNLVDLSYVREGDYVNIGTTAQSGVEDSYPILGVEVTVSGTDTTQSFDVDQIDFTGAAVQSNNAAYSFYRPTKSTISASDGRTAIVAQTTPGRVDISLPATTQAVNRGPRLAAYGRSGASLDIVSVNRGATGETTITTSDTHGLIQGGQVFLDGITPSYAVPTPSAGNTAVYPSVMTYPASNLSTLTNTQAPSASYIGRDGVCLRLSDGNILFAGGYTDLASVVTDIKTCNVYKPEASSAVGDGSVRYSHSWLAPTDIPGGAPERSHAAGSTYGLGAAITGGMAISTITDTAVYYDATTATWSNLANMSVARAGHCQTLKTNGNILVVGGASVVAGPALATTEIFSGSTWGAGPSMAVARADFQTVTLSDGRVLAIGGRQLIGGGAVEMLHDSVCTMAPGETYPWLGPVTNTVEIYDGATWTKTGSMTMARAFHRAIVLPGDFVLVVGGLGYNPTSPTPRMLAEAELYDASTGRWSRVANSGYAHARHVMEYLSGRNEVVVLGGTYDIDGTNHAKQIEIFDVSSRRWRSPPATLSRLGMSVYGSKTSDETAIVLGGGLTDTVTPETPTNAEAYLPASDVLCSGGLNGVFGVASVSTNTFTVDGLPAFTQGTTGTETPFKAESRPVNDPGPFIFDPVDGVAITSIESTTKQPLYANQQYKEVAITDGSLFPDSGYVVFGFGTSSQTPPIQYLSKYSGTYGLVSVTYLVLDFSYRFTSTQDISSTVTLISQRGAFVPADPVAAGSFYLTGSGSGRVAAQSTILESLAAGIEANITVVYPGDRGLGAEGNPVRDSQKLSDIVQIFGGE